MSIVVHPSPQTSPTDTLARRILHDGTDIVDAVVETTQ
jgi:hypothetical protein